VGGVHYRTSRNGQASSLRMVLNASLDTSPSKEPQGRKLLLQGAGSSVISQGVFHMSIKGQIKEAAGFAKEEANEHGKSAESKAKAQEGRNLRNEGRIEDGKTPKTSKPGTGH
jgi:hypothetical protein